MSKYDIPRYRIQLVRENGTDAGGKLASMKDAATAAAILREHIGDADREHFVAMLLDTKNKIIGINTVSIGTLSSSLVHPREIFKAAVLANAASMILCHNHPSGDPAPSSEDLEVTKRQLEAGKILGIQVLDHIVLGDGSRCFSFKEQGLVF